MIGLGLSFRGVLETTLLTLLFYVLYHFLSPPKRYRGPPDSIIPPEVSGGLPIIGHMISIVKEPIPFIERCYERYGKVFTIRIGIKKVTLMCDRDHMLEYFRADESKLSFYKLVEDLGFSKGFSETLDAPIPVALHFVKRAFIRRMSEHLLIMNEEILNAVKKFKTRLEFEDPLKVHDIQYILEQSLQKGIFKSIFGFDMTDEYYKDYNILTNFMLNCSFATYLLPTSFVNFITKRKMRKYRNAILSHIIPKVKEYVDDPELNETPIIRLAVDFDTVPVIGRKLTLEEVGQILFSVHFSSASTPVSVAAHTILELTKRRDLWKSIQQELGHDDVNPKEILKNDILNACVMEACRINANSLILGRKNYTHSTIGPYYLANSEYTMVPGQLLLAGKVAGYQDPTAYNPDRFLNENKEPMDPKSFWLWGAGVHSCPGRNVSINIAKIFTAYFVSNIDFKIIDQKEGDYLTFNTVSTPSASVMVAPSF